MGFIMENYDEVLYTILDTNKLNKFDIIMNGNTTSPKEIESIKSEYGK
jgi:hypothetical protein